MKIAFVLYDRPNYTGGPLINAMRLLPAFVKNGHTVLAIIGYTKSSPSSLYFKQSNVQVFEYEKKYTESDVRKILNISRKFKPDVFVSNISAQAGFAGYFIKKAGIPTIITHRSDDKRNWCTANTFGLKNWQWQSTAMVCVSNFLKASSIEKMEKRIPIEVIPSGVPLPKLNKNIENERIIKVVYTGRLIQEQKRIWDIIFSIEEFLKKSNDFHFTFIGEGKEKEKIKEFISNNNLENYITVKDKLFGTTYQNELQKHDVIVLLSDYEGMPGSLLDGMACGLTPIVYSFNGSDELIDHKVSGLIINNREKEFHDALLFLSNPLTRKELSKNARLKIEKSYSLEQTVLSWEKLFTKLMHQNSIKKRIKNPFYLNLPKVPKCYNGTKEDIRHFKYLKDTLFKKSNSRKSFINKLIIKLKLFNER